MSTLRIGSTGPEVAALVDKLRRVGFLLSPSDEYSDQVAHVVGAFQDDYRLTVDRAAGRNTVGELDAILSGRATDLDCPPQPFRNAASGREMRLSAALSLAKKADNGQGLRYGGVSVDVWQKMQAGELEDFYFPFVHNLHPQIMAEIESAPHGATCGHFAWLVLSWYYNQLNPGDQIFPTWRTGRKGAWIWKFPVAGRWLRKFAASKRADGSDRFRMEIKATKEHPKSRLHRGLADYLERVHGWRRQRMSAEYANLDRLGYVNLIEWGHHVGILIKVDANHQLTDPRTGAPARPGLYRFAADGRYPKVDGVKKYSGGVITFRRVSSKEPKTQYRLFAGAELDDFGTMTTGPLAGVQPRRLLVEQP
jgi:hypothetical protein